MAPAGSAHQAALLVALPVAVAEVLQAAHHPLPGRGLPSACCSPQPS